MTKESFNVRYLRLLGEIEEVVGKFASSQNPIVFSKSEIATVLELFTIADAIEDNCAMFRTLVEYEHSQLQSKPHRNFEYDVLTPECFTSLLNAFKNDYVQDASSIDDSLDACEADHSNDEDIELLSDHYHNLLQKFDECLTEVTMNKFGVQPAPAAAQARKPATKKQPPQPQVISAEELQKKLDASQRKKRRNKQEMDEVRAAAAAAGLGVRAYTMKMETTVPTIVATTPAKGTPAKKKGGKSSAKKQLAAPVVPGVIETAANAAANVGLLSRGSKLARGNVHPTEILKALFLELEKIGLNLFGLDEKLKETEVRPLNKAHQRLIAQGDDSGDNNNNNDNIMLVVGEPVVSTPAIGAPALSHAPKDLFQLLHFEHQTPAEDASALSGTNNSTQPVGGVSRAATTIATEYLTTFKDSIEAYDSLFFQSRRDALERCRKRWEMLCSYQSMKILGRKVQLEDIPLAMDRIPNPFDSNNNHDDIQQWDWLTNLQTIRDILAVDTTTGGITGKVESAVNVAIHPFIHEKSLFYGKAQLGQTIYSSLLTQIDPKLKDENVNGNNNNLIVSCSSSSSASRSRNDSHLSSDLTDYTKVRSSHQATVLSSPIIVDKPNYATRDENTIHRSVICAQIIGQCCGSKNYSSSNDVATVDNYKSEITTTVGSDAMDVVASSSNNNNNDNNTLDSNNILTTPDKANRNNSNTTSNKKKASSHTAATSSSNSNNTSNENWGPILVVCKLKDLSVWEEGLKTLTTSKGLEVLPYYGTEHDRSMLRSYIRTVHNTVGTGLYTERSYCHVLLINYETFLLDMHYFKDIMWNIMILDEPWGLIGNSSLYGSTVHKQLNLFPCRQVIYSSSSLSYSQSLETLSNYSEDATLFQDESLPLSTQVTFIPSLVETVNMTIPFALGITHIDHRKSYHPISNNVPTKEQEAVMLANSLHAHCASTGLIEFDAKSNQYFTKLLASTTVVCNDSSSEGVTPMTLELLPYFEWSGIQVSTSMNSSSNSNSSSDNSDDDTVMKFKLSDDSELKQAILKQDDNNSATPTEILLNRNIFIRYTNNYIDAEIDEELKFLNLEVIGQSNAQQSRVLDEGHARQFPYHASYYLSTTTTGATKGKGKGRAAIIATSGVGRFRGWGKKVENVLVADASSIANKETVGVTKAKATSKGRTKASKAQQLSQISSDVQILAPSEVSQQSFASVDQSNTAEDSNNNNNNNNNSSNNANESSPAFKKPKLEHDLKAVVDDSHNNNNHESTDVVEMTTDDAPHHETEHHDNNHEEEEGDDDVNNQQSQSQPSAAATTKGNAGTGAPKASRGSAKQMLSMEEEKKKYVWRKGALWTATIIVGTRQRYLGMFTSQQDAEKAFDAAYIQRAKAESSDQLKAKKPRGKGARDVKLTDGSLIASEYYRELTNDQIIDEIAHMTHPQLATGKHLNEWVTTNCEPPGYALLEGINGFTVTLPYCNCILGKAGATVEELATRLGDRDFGFIGMQFDYYETVEDNNDGDNENNGGGMNCNNNNTCPHSAIHIGFHPSIARRHAAVTWNQRKRTFEIRSISNAGVYVNGHKYVPDDGAVALTSKAMIQIGNCLFYFLLPLPLTNAAVHSPIHHREHLLKALLESIRLRQFFSRRDHTTVTFTASNTSNSNALTFMPTADISNNNNNNNNNQVDITAPPVIDTTANTSNNDSNAGSNKADELEIELNQYLKNIQLYEMLTVNCGYRVKSAPPPPAATTTTFSSTKPAVSSTVSTTTSSTANGNTTAGNNTVSTAITALDVIKNNLLAQAQSGNLPMNHALLNSLIAQQKQQQLVQLQQQQQHKGQVPQQQYQYKSNVLHTATVATNSVNNDVNNSNNNNNQSTQK